MFGAYYLILLLDCFVVIFCDLNSCLCVSLFCIALLSSCCTALSSATKVINEDKRWKNVIIKQFFVGWLHSLYLNECLWHFILFQSCINFAASESANLMSLTITFRKKCILDNRVSEGSFRFIAMCFKKSFKLPQFMLMQYFTVSSMLHDSIDKKGHTCFNCVRIGRLFFIIYRHHFTLYLCLLVPTILNRVYHYYSPLLARIFPNCSV